MRNIKALLAALLLGLVPVHAGAGSLTLLGAGKASAGGAATTTFDPVNKGTVTALDASHLTVTNSAGSPTDSIARTLVTTSGKVHFEIHVNSVSNAAQVEVGVCDGTASLNSFIGADAHSWGMTLGGIQVASGSSGTSLGISVAAGDTLAVEFDAAGKTIQFQKAGAGSWTTAPTYGSMPAASALYACVNVADTTASVTGNFGGSAYAVTPSAGYGNF